MKKITIILTTIAIAILVSFSALVVVTIRSDKKSDEKPVGSVGVLQGYSATSTRMSGSWIDANVKYGYGTLGSVVITKAGDAAFLLLDASTTANKIDHFSTSTKTIASFPANTAVGTYVFDVTFTDGLTLELVSGDNGTSTITYR